MALNETLTLNITEAQRQIAVLEGQLDQLSQPVNVPINVTGGSGLQEVRRDLDSSEGAVAELNRELDRTDDQLRDVRSEATRTGRELDDVGRRGATSFGNLRTSIAGLAGTLVAFAGAQQLGKFIGDSVTAASNLEQSVGALDAVFGDLSDEVAVFGETADQSVGLAASQFNQLASVLGSQLQTFGFSVGEAATETQKLITLSADLAATFGGPVSQAVEAVSSLLRGETNPIERYGVAMNEASVQARALEDGLAATAGELTFQDKTLARLAILMEQTANAQGQFGREAETTAGQMERLNAEWENTRAIVGGALVPALQAVLPIIGEVAEGVGVVALQLAESFGLIDDEVATLQILAIQSGQAADSTTLLAGAVLELQDELGNFGEQGNRASEATEDFTSEIEALVDAWSGGAREAQDLIDGLDILVEQFGLTEEAALALRTALERRIATEFATQEDAALLDNLARSFGGIAAAGPGASASLEEVGQSLQFTRRELEGFAAIGDVEVSGIFDALPDEMDAARRALNDTEGEIEDDFSDFLQNLEQELAAQQEFGNNIAALFEGGLDDLAQFFSEAGLEAAGLLADAIASPEEAARAEAALEEHARRMAIAEVDAYAATLAGQLDGINLEPIRIPIISDFTGFTLPTGGSTSSGISTGSGGGGSVITVNQTFTDPTTPTTTTARANQSTSSLVNNFS